MSDFYWRTGVPSTFIIGDQEINLEKKGSEYAKQFGQLSGWIGQYGIGALLQANERGVLTGAGGERETIVALFSFMMTEGISTEAIIELAALLIGKDKEFVEQYFDPGWVIDALIYTFEKPGYRAVLQRLWDKFFLGKPEPTARKKS